MANPFSPLLRSLAQLDDPVFLGVLWRSLAWSAASFAALLAATVWGAQQLGGPHGAWAWLATAFGAVGALLLAFWLFLPVAVVIGTLYIERIARAVERRFYPGLPQPAGASLPVQAWDGLAVGLRVLALNAVGLLLAVLLPGVGFVIAWAIAAYAIGRGLFVAVAMRRMDRQAAQALYARRRGAVLLQGAALALAGTVPLLNLLIPVIGTAAMVHVLDQGGPVARRLSGDLGRRI